MLFPHLWSLPELLEVNDEIKRSVLSKWNEAYRTGEPVVDDQTYDALLDSLPESDPLREQVGFEVGDQRKVTLPIPMFSMDKVKSMVEISKWMESKKIRPEERVVITPKYDGLSFLVHTETRQAYTRGNGSEGQRSDAHFEKVQSELSKGVPEALMGRHLIGEVIMPREVFEKKYSLEYRNPRNLVAGLFNHKTPKSPLNDVFFMAYGSGEERESKSEELAMINGINAREVPSLTTTLEKLSDEFLQQTFASWNMEFEIDGLIIELDDLDRRRQLGREKSNNPCYARAWKGFEALSALTVIRGIQYQISKDGRLSMVGQLDPIELDGVTVSNVTLNNAGMMLERGWGIGAKVRVIRSGMVIPKIVATDEKVTPTLPEVCPACESALQWNSTRVHLLCRNPNCQAQQTQSAISFFKVLGIEEMGEKIVEQLFEAGYNSVEKILHMKQEDFLALDRFAERRAKVIFENIHAKCDQVPLEKLQHALGCFKGMGAKRLALVARFDAPDRKPDFETVMSIDGFSDVMARAYLKGFDEFWELAAKLPITIAPYRELLSVEGGICEGMKVCFTGFRDKAMEQEIVAKGGEIASGVSSKTTHVVTKDAKGQSSKLKKARDLGLAIWEPSEMTEFLVGS